MTATTTTKADDYSLTSFDHVIVEKTKLLETLKTNREKHDAIYQAAVQGYWIKCKETLDEKSKSFATIIDDQNAEYARAVKGIEERFGVQRDRIAAAIEGKNKKGVGSIAVAFDYRHSALLGTIGNWYLTYPENHLDDYDRVIGMLEFSVADKVELTAQDFNAYVRNKWEWHNSFSSSNQAYVQITTGCLLVGGYSGYCGVSGGNSVDTSNSYLTRSYDASTIASSPIYQFAAGLDQ